VSVNESQIPRKNGYAKKTASKIKPGSINKTPRVLSRSKKLSDSIDTEFIFICKNIFLLFIFI
jgi:hypothetical protein